MDKPAPASPDGAPTWLGYRAFRRLQHLFENLTPPAGIDGLGDVDYFHLYVFLADVARIEVPQSQAAVHQSAAGLIRCGYRAEEMTESEYERLLVLLACAEAADQDDMVLHDFGPHRGLYAYLTEGLGLYVEPGRGPVWSRAKELVRQHERRRAGG